MNNVNSNVIISLQGVYKKQESASCQPRENLVLNSAYFGIPQSEALKLKSGDMVVYTGLCMDKDLGLFPGEIYEVESISRVTHSKNKDATDSKNYEMDSKNYNILTAENYEMNSKIMKSLIFGKKY